MGLTPNFSLLALELNESVRSNGGQFLKGNIELIDRLLAIALDHDHTGTSTIAESTPSAGPALVLTDAGGFIPAGTRVYYRYALVDSRGLETAASPIAYIDTPAAITAPDAPALSMSPTGGTLLPGDYYYVLTAYTGANTTETTAVHPAHIVAPVGTTTNEITLLLPDLPIGADGFNVYRRKVGGGKFLWLDQIDMTVATPPSVYVDDGSAAEDCDRSIPQRNSTSSTNAVTATIPALPVGHTWRLYRTYDPGDWSASMLAWIVEETAEGSGIITPQYVDLGLRPLSGQPIETILAISAPSKITLTDGLEVDGSLPPSMLAYRVVLDWVFPGDVVQGPGTFAWRCPYDIFLIESAAANLGRDSFPSSQNVIVDVNKYDGQIATPAWATIYTTQANRPVVPVGEFYGDPTTPNVTVLRRDDFLSIDVDQDGGGATPTDFDLAVQVVGYAFVDQATSVVWPE